MSDNSDKPTSSNANDPTSSIGDRQLQMITEFGMGIDLIGQHNATMRNIRAEECKTVNDIHKNQQQMMEAFATKEDLEQMQKKIQDDFKKTTDEMKKAIIAAIGSLHKQPVASDNLSKGNKTVVNEPSTSASAPAKHLVQDKEAEGGDCSTLSPHNIITTSEGASHKGQSPVSDHFVEEETTTTISSVIEVQGASSLVNSMDVAPANTEDDSDKLDATESPNANESEKPDEEEPTRGNVHEEGNLGEEENSAALQSAIPQNGSSILSNNSLGHGSSEPMNNGNAPDHQEMKNGGDEQFGDKEDNGVFNHQQDILATPTRSRGKKRTRTLRFSKQNTKELKLSQSGGPSGHRKNSHLDDSDDSQSTSTQHEKRVTTLSRNQSLEATSSSVQCPGTSYNTNYASDFEEQMIQSKDDAQGTKQTTGTTSTTQDDNTFTSGPLIFVGNESSISTPDEPTTTSRKRRCRKDINSQSQEEERKQSENEEEDAMKTITQKRGATRRSGLKSNRKNHIRRKSRKPEPKTKAQKQKETFNKHSKIWYAKQTLEHWISVINSKKLNVNETFLKTAEAYVKKPEKKLPRYLRKYIDNELSPDGDNYRHCNRYRNGYTTSTVDDIRPPENSENLPVPSFPLSLTYLAVLNEKCSLNSESIKNAADEFADTGFNKHHVEMKLVPPEIDPDLRKTEEAQTEGAEEFTKPRTTKDINRLRFAVKVVKLESKEHLLSANVRRICESHPICVLSGFGAAAGLTKEWYSLEELTKMNSNKIIDTHRQVPQSPHGNCNTEGQESWKCPSDIDFQKTLREYSKIMTEEKKLGEKLFNSVFNKEWKHSSNKELKELDKPILKFMSQEHKQQEPHGCDELWWRFFGTNIDLFEVGSNVYEKQNKELLSKLPRFMRPKFWKNLLSHTGSNILGVNTVQVYAKGPGARTPAHMENSLMRSLNLNCGPGTCVWFAVSYEYWGELVKLVDTNYERGQYHSQEYWPNEKQLLEAGIPFYKYEQRADELVFINTGTFHWVQSNGFCTNVSWNVGPATPTQLATSIIAAQHNVELKHTSIIPLSNIILNIAEKKMFHNDPMMRKIIQHQLSLMLFHTRLCENIIKKKKLQFTHDEYSADITPKFCDNCGGEAPIIVRYVTVKKDSGTEEEIWCTACNSREGVELIDETYASFCTSDKLSNIYDNWMDDNSPENDDSEDDGNFNSKVPDNSYHYGPSTEKMVPRDNGPSVSGHNNNVHDEDGYNGTGPRPSTSNESSSSQNHADDLSVNDDELEGFASQDGIESTSGEMMDIEERPNPEEPDAMDTFE